MSDHDRLSLLQDLLSRDPQDVRHWLRQAWLGQPLAPDDFNWLGLAEASAFNARSNRGDVETSLSWARVALSIYERLASDGEPDQRDSPEGSGMMLRAYLIRRYGSIPGDNVLDAQVIVDWFRATVPMTYQQASDYARVKPSIAVEQLRVLRRVKNKLSVLEGLPDVPGVHMPGDLKTWIALRKDLP